jgi:hypothetical protein
MATFLVATFAAVAPASAQYRSTGDGIAASPKVRAQMNERKASTAVVSTKAAVMACPKCKDAWVAQADTSSKGSGARTLVGQTNKLVARHLCDGCGADMSTAGAGKAKYVVAAHKCTGCGAENLACCAPKGSNDVATKGMEEKIQVAPLK